MILSPPTPYPFTRIFCARGVAGAAGASVATIRIWKSRSPLSSATDRPVIALRERFGPVPQQVGGHADRLDPRAAEIAELDAFVIGRQAVVEGEEITRHFRTTH